MVAIAEPATPGRPARPPYRGAVVVFLVVLAGYLWTLAPTVTFWDAGEFIATAKILGIPHPPGTPLFILLGNVWGNLVRIGEFAYRLNLMTAMFSAAASALFFLLIVQALRGWRLQGAGNPGQGARRKEPGTAGGSHGGTLSAAEDTAFTIGGGVAAVLAGAFAFTVWQNSNETEVYMVATFSIAAICWLAWLWRRHRGTERAAHLLLVIVYLAAVSVGNHLMTLLVGPALIGYMWHVLRTEPLGDERDRKTEWAQWAVVGGVWALLIGLGLGSTSLLILGGVVFLAAAGYAASVGGAVFAAAVLGIAVAGASTYLFLIYRARVGPLINEADPSTWENLWAVIRREQYPPRSPIDNPIYPSGPDNPGRTFQLIWWQLLNYLQYYDWQWSNGLDPTQSVFARVRLPFTLLFTSLGIYGATVLRDRDRSVFWLLLLLFLTTGPGLMGYMNFKPGFSLAYDIWPELEMHEVRERDYFFTVSFLVWGIFAGLGVAGLSRLARRKLARLSGSVAQPRLALAVLGLAALPFVLNFRAASRAHGPEATLARDFAYDLLQSAEPYGIVFTNGDNDTFPLWYIQEVEEVRQDVTVVNLSLGNTDWYIRQLRDNPVRHFRPEQAPWFADLAPAEPPPPVHTMSDQAIAGLRATILRQGQSFRVGRLRASYPEGTPIYVKDVLILRLIQENWQRRPIYFSLTAGSGNWVQLGQHLTQQALVFRLHPETPPDSSRLESGIFGPAVDLPRTDSLAWEVYRYAGLFEVDSLALDPTNENIARNLSFPFFALGQAYQLRGQRQLSLENLRRAYQLNPVPQLKDFIEAVEAESISPELFGDTPVAQPSPAVPQEPEDRQ